MNKRIGEKEVFDKPAISSNRDRKWIRKET